MTTSPLPQFPHYYDATEHFAKRFDRLGRQLAFRGRTRAEAIAWQKKFGAKLRDVFGWDTYQPTKPRPQLLGKEDLGSHWREDWIIHTEPDIVATYYALIPKNLQRGERRAAVICPHGHASAGRFSPAGRRDIPVVADRIETYNYDYAVKLAERGFVTFAPDARGFGQRRIQHKQENDPWFVHGSCHELMIMGAPLGQPVAGMWTWDLMRLVDVIAKRPDVDAQRIGCAGLSGGGFQTLYLAALDPRIKAAVVSGYFYGVKDSLIRLAGNCDCNCVPNLWKYGELGDVGGLIAPRPLFIETGDQDNLNGKLGLANVRSQVNQTRKVYRALGAADNLGHHIFPGAHRWCGEQAIPWLEKHLGEKE